MVVIIDKSQKIVIGNDWPNALLYDQRTQKYVSKKTIWNENQNIPDLVVEDILDLFAEFIDLDDSQIQYIRDRVYAILLQRGITKWLTVRKLLIRLKKLYVNYIEEIRKIKSTKKLDPKKYMYLKGKESAYVQIRKELALLCKGPRWCIFNGKEMGLIDTIGMKRGDAKNWIALTRKLLNERFPK